MGYERVATPGPATPARNRRLVGAFGVSMIIGISAVFVFAIAIRLREPTTGPSCSRSPDRLVRAAADGDTDEVRAQLGTRPVATAIDEHGNTPLYCAIENRHLDAARVLLVAGADPDRESEASRLHPPRPLSLAVDLGSSELVSLLLDHGADPDGRGAGASPVSVALRTRNRELVTLLLDRGADPDFFDRNAGLRTPLGLAVDTGDVALVTLLLDRGADPNRPDSEGTPLFNAAGSEHGTEVATLLVARGAQPDLASIGWCIDLAPRGALSADNREGCAFPIGAAARAGNAPTVAMLLEHGADPTAGIYAASVGNRVDTLRLLLDHGGDPNGLGGTSPLLYNVLLGNAELVAVLLERGADPDLGGPADAATLQTGAALLGLANAEQSMPRALLEATCRIKGTAPNLPPLVVAAAMGRADQVSDLLAHGADPSLPAMFEPAITPVAAATFTNNRHILPLLEAAGANLEVPVVPSTSPRGTTTEFCR